MIEPPDSMPASAFEKTAGVEVRHRSSCMCVVVDDSAYDAVMQQTDQCIANALGMTPGRYFVIGKRHGQPVFRHIIPPLVVVVCGL